MPIIRTTRGAFFRAQAESGTSEHDIPGVVYVAFRLVRDWQVGELADRIAAKSKFVFGEIATTDMDVALSLFDLTAHGGSENQLGPYDMIVRYTEENVNKFKVFKDVMTGVGFGGDKLGTVDRLVDDGSLQLQIITFMLRMPPSDAVASHILTENEP